MLVLVVEESDELFGYVVAGECEDVVYFCFWEFGLDLAVVDVDVYNDAEERGLIGRGGGVWAAAHYAGRADIDVDVLVIGRCFEVEVQIPYALPPEVAFQVAGDYFEGIDLPGVEDELVDYADSADGSIREAGEQLVERLSEYPVFLGDVHFLRVVNVESFGKGEQGASGGP